MSASLRIAKLVEPAIERLYALVGLLRKWLIDQQRRIFRQRVRMRVRNDADHRQRRLILPEESLDVLAHRRPSRPEPVRNRLADNQHRRRIRLVRIGDVAASEQWNADGAEVARGDKP